MTDLNELLKRKKYLDYLEEGENNLTFYANFILRNNEVYPIKIQFDINFPAYLPDIYLNKRDVKSIDHPHIDRNGKICFLDITGLVWSQNPSECIDFTFEQVEKLLSLDEHKLRQEYHKEYDYFILSLDNSKMAFSIGDDFNDIEDIELVTRKTKPIIFLKKDSAARDILSRKLFEENNNINSNGIFIRLSKQYHGDIPRYNRFWSAKDIVNIIKSYSTENVKTQLNEISYHNKQNYYYLIELTLLTGRKVLLGIWYRRFMKNKSAETLIPILDKDAERYFEIIPIYMQRIDKTLVDRTGGQIFNDKVLLVGCGSLGSNVLFMLSQAGFTNITIVDNDKIYPENTCRHFLGVNYGIRQLDKVKALKTEIESRYPFTRISSYNDDVLKLIHDSTISYKNYDLVIVAVGNPNIEKQINRELIKHNIPAIYSWIEPYGLGGHSLLISDSNQGCYECIFRDGLFNEISFAAVGKEPYIKNSRGCGGSYTPYGNLDAMQSALVTIRLILKFINEKIKGNMLASWKGDCHNFVSQGYETSQRYNDFNDTISFESVNFTQSNCPCCSKEGA